MKLPVGMSDLVQRQRTTLLERADRQNFKRGQDVEVGEARLILTADDGTRYEFEIGSYGQLVVKTIDGVEMPGLNQSQFSENKVVARTPVVELNSAYGTTALRDVETVTGSGAISSAATGEILLSTGATATSSARLDSSERLRYIPGFGAEGGVGVRVPVAPTGNQEAKWGFRNPGATEGIYFGVDATGFYVATLRDGVETKVRQSSFNIDVLDGTGKSGLTLDLEAGNIFQINFTWYGYGQILFQLVDVVNDTQRVVPLHNVKPNGATSLRSPNLPIFVEADNGGDAADFDVYVGGRQASIVGLYVPKFRVTGQDRAAVSTSTTSVPLVSFRNKTGFEDRSVQIDASSTVVASQDHVIEFVLDPTLTGASWTTPTNHTASETALETDVSATAMSGGTVVYSYFAPSGQANKDLATSAIPRFDIPENQIITMAARTVTGSGDCTAFFRLKEEW